MKKNILFIIVFILVGGLIVSNVYLFFALDKQSDSIKKLEEKIELMVNYSLTGNKDDVIDEELEEAEPIPGEIRIINCIMKANENTTHGPASVYTQYAFSYDPNKKEIVKSYKTLSIIYNVSNLSKKELKEFDKKINTVCDEHKEISDDCLSNASDGKVAMSAVIDIGKVSNNILNKNSNIYEISDYFSDSTNGKMQCSIKE